jgi:hypothetical protein
MDAKVLRDVIRRRLLNGQLSPTSSVVTFGGTPANGEICDACGTTIFSGQLIIHGVARQGSRERTIQFHVVCFGIWNDEKSARM